MKKGLFKRENIGKIVRLMPVPTTNGKLIARSRNFWLILQEYDEGEGIEVLNKITNHRGQIPYDSIREWREPDNVILSTQVNLGKEGLFEITPFIDEPETEKLIKEELTRITRLRATSLAAVLGLIALLWLSASYWMQPPDRATINWVELLWSGKKLSVDIGDLPEHAKGSLLVEGRSYTVWYQQDPCLWQSTGPVQLPKSRGGEVVENHYNKAGVAIGREAHLNRTESATATAECNSPRDRKMVVLGLGVDIDRRGYLSFGGSQHRIGALRVPDGWAWPWSKR
jgi:hypothetical protein